ncbi:uncharacterized protein E5676_scaffold127G001170 [Cucumis melo var. makuwa]|uniref:Uncharacterized protein n=1 Tax=Cucumis melo var. makuwa TaxID=1194695 RepID=A0A5A7T8R7_CUCMM|nr:uncharacterized protein E6C27_scaffold36G00280 [Cucumis melo var. makuwa]TYK09817.1 uncharacterized protein E5676_scaffold127G001170 [Cucumis melo var. makuwa]
MASFYYRQDRKLLRLISSPINKRVDGIRDNQKEEFVVPTVDEVVDILKSDYENAYFVTGVQSVKIEIDGNKLVKARDEWLDVPQRCAAKYNRA